MRYDFTTVLDRRSRDSTAADVIPFEGFQVDEGFSTIPMWIADMSFKAAPPVLEAIYKRMEMPNFGYFPLPKEYFDSIIRWQQRRNGVEGLLPEIMTKLSLFERFYNQCSTDKGGISFSLCLSCSPVFSLG